MGIDNLLDRNEDFDRRPKPQRYIYFAATDGRRFVKIGCSASPESRIRSLGIPCSKDKRPGKGHLECLGCFPGTIQEEHGLHLKFKKDRLYGEWFLLTPEILEFLESHPKFVSFCPSDYMLLTKELMADKDQHMAKRGREMWLAFWEGAT